MHRHTHAQAHTHSSGSARDHSGGRRWDGGHNLGCWNTPVVVIYLAESTGYAAPYQHHHNDGTHDEEHKERDR